MRLKIIFPAFLISAFLIVYYGIDEVREIYFYSSTTLINAIDEEVSKINFIGENELNEDELLEKKVRQWDEC